MLGIIGAMDEEVAKEKLGYVYEGEIVFQKDE